MNNPVDVIIATLALGAILLAGYGLLMLLKALFGK